MGYTVLADQGDMMTLAICYSQWTITFNLNKFGKQPPNYRMNITTLLQIADLKESFSKEYFVKLHSPHP